MNDSVEDSLHDTSEIIYELHWKKRLEGSKRTTLIFLVSMLLAICSTAIIGILQYDEYVAYVNQRYEYIESRRGLCNSISLVNIDVVSTPIAAALILYFVVVYKRRVFLRNKYKYRNIGLPMITSMWSKTDRLFSAVTYGSIAYNVFSIIKNTFNENSSSKKIIPFTDPSGVLPLLVKIAEVLLVGIRYYPVLVAYRANTFFLNLTTSIYIWVDFIENIYQYGKCESFYAEAEQLDDLDFLTEASRRLNYFISYKVLSALPLSVFSSIILVTLTYKTIINIFDFFYQHKHSKYKLLEKSRDTFCCTICNIDDDHEVIYNHQDVQYVLDLFNKNAPVKTKVPGEDPTRLFRYNSLRKNTFKYIVIDKVKEQSKLEKFFRTFVYNWDPTFRFTSRFISTMVVGLTSLYYFFLFLLYTVSMNVTEQIEKINFNSTIFNPNGIQIELGKELCNQLDVCIESLIDAGSVTIPTFGSKFNLAFDIKSSLLAIFLVPIFSAVIICLAQVFLLARDARTHLREMFVGKCDYVRRSENLGNQSIAASSFHFGGYFVGYLIWGFLILYIFGLLIGLVILGLRIFVGDAFFGQIALKVVPVITVIVFKQALNFVTTRFIFLNRESKVLALNNFRAFNVFVYFNFYFDCFMGVLSALIRLVKSVIIAVLMMPRLSYSFLGRHFEKMDNAYSCYSGFLHMESVHTNPIIISFCSVLYYKQLAEHIRRYKEEKSYVEQFIQSDERIRMAKFNGRVSSIFQLDEERRASELTPIKIRAQTKQYNKFVVNKWHVMLMLSRNLALLQYRKRGKNEKSEVKEASMAEKIKEKLRFCSKLNCSSCCKRNDQVKAEIITSSL